MLTVYNHTLCERFSQIVLIITKLFEFEFLHLPRRCFWLFPGFLETTQAGLCFPRTPPTYCLAKFKNCSFRTALAYIPTLSCRSNATSDPQTANETVGGRVRLSSVNSNLMPRNSPFIRYYQVFYDEPTALLSKVFSKSFLR